MIASIWKSSSVKPNYPLADEASAVDLVNFMVQKMLDGVHKSDVIVELRRQHWSKKDATLFCAEISKIVHEIWQLPEQRALFVKRAQEQMQAGLGWIGSGFAAWLLLSSTMPAANRANVRYVLLAPLFGMYEFAAGFLRWFPHRHFQMPTDKSGADKNSPDKGSRMKFPSTRK